MGSYQIYNTLLHLCTFRVLILTLSVFSGGGEPARERHLRCGEQDPGAEDFDQPVSTQAAPRQHQPAQHVSQWRHRCCCERRHRQISGGTASRQSEKERSAKVMSVVLLL